MQEFDVLVIGGGPAAITIAKNIGNSKKLGVIRPEDHSMIYCAMPYVIEDILPFEKTLKKDELVTDAGATLIRDCVESVDFDTKTVISEKGDTYSYDKLVIATGANPVLPPIEGADFKEVMTFKTEEDLKKILHFMDRGIQKAVVVGAGAIGIELSQALNKKNIETHLVDMEDQILPNMMDYEMVEDAEEELIKSGVNLHLREKVTALKGHHFVENVVLEKGHTIHFGSLDDCSESEREEHIAGLVVFAVGVRPNIDIFKETALEIGHDGIIVNERMETNIKDVYAVGDCVQFTNAVTGKTAGGKLATNAVPMGKIAAKNILGERRVYGGFYNGAATKIGKYYLGGTGLSEKAAREMYDVVTGYAEFTTSFPVMPSAKKVKLKLIADRNTLKVLGGQVVSGEPVTDKIDLVTMTVQYGIKIDELAGFSYSAQPYQSFFPANNLLVRASEEILRQL